MHSIDFGQAPPKIIAAIPLEPPARIRPYNPTLLPPNRQRLTALYAKIIQPGIGNLTNLCLIKPVIGKFLAAIVQVLTFKYAKLKHLLRRKGRLKSLGKSLAHRCHEHIAITGLHTIPHADNRTKGKIVSHQERV